MVHTSRNANREASLELSLQAFKSLVADYAQRAKHAEATAATLMREKMDADGIEMLAKLIGAQMEQRATSMAVHQQALIQTTLIALTTASREDDATLRDAVNNVQKALTTALAQMNNPHSHR